MKERQRAMVEQVEEIAKRRITHATARGCMLRVQVRQHALRAGEPHEAHRHARLRAIREFAGETCGLMLIGGARKLHACDLRRRKCE